MALCAKGRAMKVKELIELLQQENPEALVLSYAREDWEKASEVTNKTKQSDEDLQWYCQADHPDVCLPETTDYVMIGN